jgi:hypothetical protein
MLMDNLVNSYVDLGQLKEAEQTREKVLEGAESAEENNLAIHLNSNSSASSVPLSSHHHS